MRLLLVEDDALLGDAVRAGLMQDGYSVDWVQDGHMADVALGTGVYGLLVLDLGLPHLAGLDVLKRLRERGAEIPVIILTARDSVADRVHGLDSGADDYLVKPFDLNELAARIRVLLRRHAGRAVPQLVHGDVILDPGARTVTVAGSQVDLTHREFTLLQELLENRGRVMSRERLGDSLYRWNKEAESNAIEVHIHHLRKKLRPELIRTIRGVGYMIDRLPDT